MTNPRAIRAQVKGDILSLKKPNSAWVELYEGLEPFPVRPQASVCLLYCSDLGNLTAEGGTGASNAEQADDRTFGPPTGQKGMQTSL